MTDPGDGNGVPGPSGLSWSGLSFTSGRGLPGWVTGLSSTPPPPGRLSSLRSRDLTLGGFKKPKKTFEPNINALRKNKDELKEEIHVTPRKDRREREERNRERRGRRKERPQTIQSHSIFEQGPADTVRKTAWHGATDVCDTSPSAVCKLIKKERRDSEEDEDTILSKLQRDDFIDDPGLRNDSKLKPIQLPLYQSSNFLRTETPTSATECKEDLPSSSMGLPLFKTPAQSRTEFPRPEHPSLAEVFQKLSLSGREELFFIQLPDCMPGSPPASKGDPSTCPTPEKPGKKEGKTQDKRTAHLKVQEPAVKESCPDLSYFSEGLLGKLHIRKSGKVQLRLGHIVMDVSEGAAFSFLQELVSVRLNDSKVGDMTVLGNVNHKLVFSPDFQTLLQQTPSQPPPGHR